MVTDKRINTVLPYLKEAYPAAKAFLLGGSAARGDGIAVQDLDIKIIDGADDGSHKNGCYLADWKLDLSFETSKRLADMDNLLGDPYQAGFYHDAILLYDCDGDLDAYLREFKEKYPLPSYHQRRIRTICKNLDEQFHALSSAMAGENGMTAHCRFATYTWTLCDALLVRHLRSPSWICGLQKAGAAAPAAAGQIIEAEGGQYVTWQQLHQLLALYSELWQGEFWNFLKKEMVCLAHNHMVPQAFHALQTCCMMAMETPGREAYYDRWLAIMEGEKGILQKGRDYMCQFHQQMTWHLLGEVM